MTAKTIAILLLIFHMIDGKTQNDIIGKTFKAKEGATCKEFNDGGCMIYTYLLLNFNKDSVVVSYKVVANCSPKEREYGYTHMYDRLTKTYKWTMSNNIVDIEGFIEHGKLTLTDSKLISKKNVFIEVNPNNSIFNPKSSFDYYFAHSRKDWNDTKNFKKWTEKKDTAIYTLGYFRGDCCGSIPNPSRIFAKIINDTIYVNYNRQREPNCDSSIGLCGMVIDFVIDTKKYPNYRNLIWKEDIVSKFYFKEF
ncbi:MAG: hypothetical protein V4608_13125 [Bacteroidota bacterium]